MLPQLKREYNKSVKPCLFVRIEGQPHQSGANRLIPWKCSFRACQLPQRGSLLAGCRTLDVLFQHRGTAQKAFPYGGSEGPENVPVAHFHRGTGRQAPESECPENRPVACFQRTAGRQAPAVPTAGRRMRLFRLSFLQEWIVSSISAEKIRCRFLVNCRTESLCKM